MGLSSKATVLVPSPTYGCDFEVRDQPRGAGAAPEMTHTCVPFATPRNSVTSCQRTFRFIRYSKWSLTHKS